MASKKNKLTTQTVLDLYTRIVGVIDKGEVLSEQKFITCGVPQGSILGPILFLLYINDIKNSSKILNFFLFADDTSTLLINKKVEEIEKIYNEELRHVSE